MKKSLAQLFGCLGLVICVGYASQDRKANELFVQAYQLVKDGEKAEKTSYSDAFRYYADALEKLGKITSKYSYSQIAVDLVQGKAKIKEYTMEELESLVKNTKTRANAEEDIIKCALLLANTMENVGDKQWAFSWISRAYAQTKQFDQSLEVVARMEDSHSKVSALTSIAGSYVVAGQNEKVLELLSQAIETSKTIQNPRMKSSALAGIAAKYTEVGEYDKGLDLVNTIEKNEYRESAFSGIVGAYAKVGEYQKAFDLVKRIEDTRRRGKAISEIVSAYSAAGEYERALQLGETIEDGVYKSVAFSHIVTEYSKAGKYQRAVDMAKRIEGNRYRDEVFVQIVEECVNAGKFDKALKISRAIEDDEAKTLSLALINSKYIETGENDKAIEIAMGIEDADSKIFSLIFGNWEHAEPGHKEKAIKVLFQAIEDAKFLVEIDEENVFIFVLIARTYDELGEKERADKIMSKVHQLQYPPFSMIIQSLIEGKGHMVVVSRHMSIALDLLIEMKDNDDKAMALVEIAAWYAKTGQKIDERAKKILHEIIREVG